MKGVKRAGGRIDKDTLKAEFDQLVARLKPDETQWFAFRDKAREFIGLYEAVSPDPCVLEFTADLKWVALFLQYATQVIEKREAFDQRSYSRKIRDMLDRHLDATGLSVTVKLRHITDPEFWEDFETEGKTEDDLKEAAIRKTTELRKVVYERLARNAQQYGKFSDRLRELLKKLDGAQLSWADKLKMAEDLAKDLEAEATAHKEAGLLEGAYGILQVLLAFDAGEGAERLAERIAALYGDDAAAPPLWQEKQGLRKSLRQQVRGLVHAFGLGNLKEVSEQVEEFALKHFAKV
jgi:type I restriction enzyme R subunit